jgi:ferritin
MLHAKIEAALNRQINLELGAAYNYLSMACWFEQENLVGFAQWMRVQRNEEHVHAEKLLTYLIDRDGKAELQAVPKPPASYKNVIEVFQQAYQTEKANTKAIYELYSLAAKLDDYATQSQLKWFLDEQVEEEKTFDEALSLLKRAGDDRSALIYLNDKFGARTPAPEGGAN